MIKLISVLISLSIMSAGGAAIAQKSFDNVNTANANSQSCVQTNKNADLNLQDSSDLFLRANTNPIL